MPGAVGLRRGTIKATVLIETIPAAFEMNEILYELRVRCAAARAGSSRPSRRSWRWTDALAAARAIRGA